LSRRAGESASRVVRAPGIALAVMWLVPATARAGNNDTIPMGDLAAVTGGAVVAAGDDPGSVSYNPAGLVGIYRSSVSISATLFEFRRFHIPAYLQTQTPAGRVAAEAAYTAFASIPPAVIFARKFRPDVAGALSLTVPDASAMNTSLRNDASVPDAFELREHVRTIGGRALYRGGVTVAWAPRPELRLGMTLHLALLRESQLFAFELSMLEPSGRRTYINVERTDTITAGGLGGIVGVQWAFARHFATGFGLEPPLLGLFGSTRSEDSTFSSRTSDGQVPLVIDQATTNTTPTAGTSIGRWIARWGVAVTGARGWLSAQLDFLPKWDQQTGANVRAGGIYALSQTIRIGGGAFTDFDTPRSTKDLRFDFVGGTAGILWRKHLDDRRDAPSTVVLSTTVAARYAYGWGVASAVVADPANAELSQFVTVGASNGTIHELSFYLGSGVDF
jgi:hypothetical protein